MSDNFWTVDKVWHCLGHALIGCILSLWIGIDIAIIVSEVIGWGTELIQKKKYIIPISWLDILWNHIGLVSGVTLALSIWYT